MHDVARLVGAFAETQLASRISIVP